MTMVREVMMDLGGENGCGAVNPKGKGEQEAGAEPPKTIRRLMLAELQLSWSTYRHSPIGMRLGTGDTRRRRRKRTRLTNSCMELSEGHKDSTMMIWTKVTSRVSSKMVQLRLCISIEERRQAVSALKTMSQTIIPTTHTMHLLDLDRHILASPELEYPFRYP